MARTLPPMYASYYDISKGLQLNVVIRVHNACPVILMRPLVDLNVLMFFPYYSDVKILWGLALVQLWPDIDLT